MRDEGDGETVRGSLLPEITASRLSIPQQGWRTARAAASGREQAVFPGSAEPSNKAFAMKSVSPEFKEIVMGLSDPQYPPLLKKGSMLSEVPALTVVGNPGLLLRQAIGLICSRRCPGSIVLQMYEIVQKLKLHGCIVVGGFHSPMERECLEVLLTGRSGIVLCPARSVRRMRIRPGWTEALSSGRMAIVSSFGECSRRCTKSMAGVRNRMVASLSAALIVPHAAPGSSTEQLARELCRLKKSIMTFDDPSNDNLLRLGAQRLEWSTLQPGIELGNTE